METIKVHVTLLIKLLEFTIPKQPKGMKGRPITGEEFDRMLASSSEWDFYLRGPWLSGLRLGESMSLRWDDAPGALLVDFTGRRPMLNIPAESEKGNTSRWRLSSPNCSKRFPRLIAEGLCFIYRRNATDAPRRLSGVRRPRAKAESS